MSAVKELEPKQLVIEPSVQRPLSMGQARAIAKDFDPAALGVIEVTERKDGLFTVNDGQTRVAAAKLAKYTGGFLARVHAQVSEKKQAELFLKLNNQRAVSNVDKFHVAVTAEMPRHVMVQRVLSVRGWKISTGSQTRTTSAVNALLELAQRGEEQLERTVKIIDQAWAGEARSMPHSLVRSLGSLVCDQGWLDTEHMTESLKGVTAQWLQAKASQAVETTGVSKHAAMVSLIAAQYNKGLRSSKRLALKE